MKKKVSKNVKRRLTLIIGPISIGIFCITLLTIISYTYAIHNLYNTKLELKEKLAYLKKDANNMSSEIVKLKDPEYIAKYARENYYYTKNGEYVLKIIKDKKENKKSNKNELYYYYAIASVIVLFIILLLFNFKKKKK